MKETEQLYLQHCRRLIEERLDWGSCDQWTNQDFLQLSDIIFEETSVSLSATTLKRIWGKVKYNSAPNITTLNVLAQFAGYSDWRSLKAASFTLALQEVQKPQSVNQSKVYSNAQQLVAYAYQQDKKVLFSALCIMLILLIGGGSFVGYLYSIQAQSSLAKVENESLHIFFNGKPVTIGVPNTVIFNYDASAANSDSIYIQQSSQPEQSIKISKQDSQFTAMYYYPGAYQANLLIDGKPIKQEQFVIQTKGWTALVERDTTPLYFQENIISQGALSLPVEKLAAAKQDMQNHTPWLAYYNVQDFGELYSDNFVLQTALKSEFSQGEAVCQDSSLVILYENAPSLIIPLSIPACLAKVDQQLKAQGLKTKNTNLLAFGVDFSDWVEVECEAKDKQLRLRINQQLAYQGTLPQHNSKIIGIGYRFRGAGAVNYISLGQHAGEQIYFEDFNG